VSETYVHGYRARENERLQDQAGTLVDLLHSDTSYPSGSVVLRRVWRWSPDSHSSSNGAPAHNHPVDISATRSEARRWTDGGGLTNVRFQQRDISRLAPPFARHPSITSSSVSS